MEDDQASAEHSTEVRAGELTEAVVVMNAGALHARAVESDGSPAPDRVLWEILSTKTDLSGRHRSLVSAAARNEFVLPAGEFLLRASSADRVVQEKIEIEAGARLEVEIPLPPANR